MFWPRTPIPFVVNLGKSPFFSFFLIFFSWRGGGGVGGALTQCFTPLIDLAEHLLCRFYLCRRALESADMTKRDVT